MDITGGKAQIPAEIKDKGTLGKGNKMNKEVMQVKKKSPHEKLQPPTLPTYQQVKQYGIVKTVP